MVAFELDGAHPGHQAVIEATINRLAARYPMAPLREVKLYEPMPGDRSLGNADEPGVIKLNAYWFSQSPEVLQQAALEWPMMPLGNGREIPWHGQMLDEPEHTTCHEFGHILAQALPKVRRVAQTGWRADTKDPTKAVSGYAIAVGADEWWAENFAAHELGFQSAPAVVELLNELAVDQALAVSSRFNEAMMLNAALAKQWG